MTHSDALRALERGGLLRRSAGSDGSEYAFHHVLSQEAAYHTLLKADRARLHADVASVTLALAGGPAGEAASDVAASLVFHFERAGDDEALCAWAVRAGVAANRRFASHEALDYFDRALGAAERCSAGAPRESVRTAFSERGHILRNIGDPARALANFQSMRTFGERAGDDGIAIEALNQINTIRLITPDGAAGGSFGDLDEDIARARSLADSHGDSALCARAVWNAGLRVRFTDLERAAALFDEALAIAGSDPDRQRLDLREITAAAAADLSLIRAVSGQYDLALAHSVQAVAASRTLENGALLADALGNLAMNSLFVGDGETLERAADEAIAISTAARNPWGLAYSRWPRIERMINCGEYDRARDQIAETLPSAHAARMPAFIGFYQAMACRLARLAGESGQALAAARESEAAFLSMGGENWTLTGLGMGAMAELVAGNMPGAHERLARVWFPDSPPALPSQGFNWVTPAYGEYAMRAGAAATALPYLDWYIQARERHGARHFAAEGRYWRGRLRALALDDEGANDDLIQARATFDRLGGYDHLWRVDAALSTLARRRGDTAAAAAAAARAQTTVADLAGRLENPAHRLALLRQLEAETDE